MKKEIKIFPKKKNLGKRNWGSEDLIVLIPKVLSLKKLFIKKVKKVDYSTIIKRMNVVTFYRVG